MKVIIKIEFPEYKKLPELKLRCNSEKEMKKAFLKLSRIKLDA